MSTNDPYTEPDTGREQLPPDLPYDRGGLMPPGVYWNQPQPRKTNGLAVAGFVLGILWLFWLGSILAIIFGHTARSQIKGDPRQDGDGLALAGLILGYVGAATFALFVVLPLLLGAMGA